MKVHLYAGNMNLNRKDAKICRNTKSYISFLEPPPPKKKKNDEDYFQGIILSGYLANILF